MSSRPLAAGSKDAKARPYSAVPAVATAPVLHRVAPAPISSGLSFRELPEATLAQVIKTCQHYEDKAAGSCAVSSPTARYLYDLSREVQDLVRVLKTREDAQAHRIRELEYTLRDWLEAFGNPGPELQAAGVSKACGTNVPAAVARRVAELAAAASTATATTAVAANSMRDEVLSMRGAMRDAARVAREQAAVELGRVKAEADAVVAATRAAAAAFQAQCQQDKADFEAQTTREAEARIAAAEANARAEVAQANTAAAEAVDAANAARDEARRGRAAAEADAAAAHTAAAAAAALHEQEVHRLQGTIADLHAEAAAAAAAHKQALADLEAGWRARLADEAERHARSVAAQRVAALEASNAFLAQRVTELQQLVEALQQSLLRHQAAAATAAATGSSAASPRGLPSKAAASSSTGTAAAGRSGVAASPAASPVATPPASASAKRGTRPAPSPVAVIRATGLQPVATVVHGGISTAAPLLVGAPEGVAATAWYRGGATATSPGSSSRV